MILVLIVCGILIVLMLFFLIILFSTIKINLKKLEASNIGKEKIEYDFLINIGLYMFGIIKIFGISISKNKIEKSKLVKKMHLEDIHPKPSMLKELSEDIKKLHYTLQLFYLKLDIGTEDILLTSGIVWLISTAISIYIPYKFKGKTKDINYKILPLYKSKNLFKISLNCIINIKMVHIISIIYIYLKKKRRSENEYARPSDRRFNDNSHEQYSRYGRC